MCWNICIDHLHGLRAKSISVLNRSSWIFFDKSFIVKQILKIVFISHENWLNKQHQTNKRFVVCIRMKSHWIKWVRLFYALFYIYRIRCVVYMYFSVTFAKKTPNKPNLTLIKNKWHQVHTNTLIRAYFNFIILVFRLFFFYLRHCCYEIEIHDVFFVFVVSNGKMCELRT